VAFEFLPLLSLAQRLRAHTAPDGLLVVYPRAKWRSMSAAADSPLIGALIRIDVLIEYGAIALCAYRSAVASVQASASLGQDKKKKQINKTKRAVVVAAIRRAREYVSSMQK